MEAVLDCIDFTLRAALDEIEAVVLTGDRAEEGLELRAWLGEEGHRRPFLVRCYLDAGVLCEGERDDILRFHAACARHDFRFRLDQMALCG